MNRKQFRRGWSAVAWILLIGSWITDFTIYGINPFFIVIGMWILGGPITRFLFGKPEQEQGNQDPQAAQYPQSETQQDNVQPSCPSCGFTGMAGDVFCQECGTRFEEPSRTPSSSLKKN